MKTLTVGSLFSGIGGLELGFERAGMEVAFQAEYDKQARRVLERHWPDVHRYEDVHDVRDAANIDVHCGGFPCQDYSVAGQRSGLAGDRGALWWEMHRIVAECRPSWVVGENVPGLLSSNGGRDFRAIVNSLVQVGYGVCWTVLDSQYFGVAQRRRRLFIVGHSGGIPRPEVLALSEGLFGHPAPSREAGEGATGGPKRGVNWDGGEIAGALGSTTDRQLMPDKGRMQAVVAPTVTSKWAKGSGGPAGSECGNLVTQSVAPLLTGSPARTLTAETGQRNNGTGQNYVQAQQGPRRLTPRECERLQGFPDGWTEFYADGSRVADGPRYRMLGNAVTVNVSEWIGRRIMEAG